MIAQLLLSAVVSTGLVREWRRRSILHSVGARLPRGEDGVIVGASSIRLGDGGRGVLLLHGFGDTPQSLRSLAESLHATGWTVRVPLLPGHGRSLSDFAGSSGGDWLEGARAALMELQGACAPVCIVGQSMGGALATILAEDSAVAALVLLAPYYRLPRDAAWLARLHGAARLVVPWIRAGTERSLLNPDARRSALGFGVTTPRLLRELAIVARRGRAAQAALRVPTLVMHSLRDPRIARRDAEAGWQELGAPTRRIRWLERSGHVVSADYDRDVVAREVAAWLAQHAGEASLDNDNVPTMRRT